MNEENAGKINSRTKQLILLLLLLASLLLLAARLHTYDEPFQNDLTFYSLVAHEMLAGKKLFVDVWDHKPPAIFVTYEIAELIAGFGPNAMFLLSFVPSLLCLLGVTYCLYRFCKSTVPKADSFTILSATAVVAFLWAIQSGDPLLEGNQANTELFQCVAKIWVFGLVLSTNSQKKRWLRFFVIGLLCTVASFYKQPAVIFAGALAAAYLLYELQNPSANATTAVRQVLLAAAVAIVGWLLMLLYYYLCGRFTPFWDSIVTYNMAYSASSDGLLTRIVRTIASGHLFPMRHTVFLVLVTLWGGILGLRRNDKARRTWMLLFVYVVSQVVEVALPGRFSHHYYFLLFPPFVLGAAFAMVEISLRFNSRQGTVVLALLLLLSSCWLQMPFYRLPSKAWPKIKYPWLEFAETRDQAWQLKGVLKPDEVLYQWGGATGLYYYLGRRPPVSIIYAFHAQYGPIRDTLAKRLLAELQARPPDMIAVVQHLSFFSPVADWIMANYVPLSKIPLKSRVAFFGLRGSRVAKEYGGIEMEAVDVTQSLKPSASKVSTGRRLTFLCEGSASGVVTSLPSAPYVCALRLRYGIEFSGSGAGAAFVRWKESGKERSLMYWLEPGMAEKNYYLWLWGRPEELKIFPHLTSSKFAIDKLELLVAKDFDKVKLNHWQLKARGQQPPSPR